MAEESGVDRENKSIMGPDLFGFYKCELVNLLSQDHNENVPPAVNVPPFSGVSSLFSDSIENVVPDFKRELFKSSLRQGVRALTREVDEVFDPVIRIRHVISCLNSRRRENFGGEALVVGDSTTKNCKKLKTSSTNAKGEQLVDQSRDAEKEADVSVDLKLLLESDPIMVENSMTKQTDELISMLNHMEKQLEDLLHAVVSKCRPMTRQEKQHLQKLIVKLPARNLDRIVEIVHHGKSSDTVSFDEIFVDLEEQENVTLWRLYFYVKAVDNARKLSA